MSPHDTKSGPVAASFLEGIVDVVVDGIALRAGPKRQVR
jgi:hypothetical protein